MVRKKILLVDDDPVFAASVEAILRSRYEVRTASNGSECLRMVAENPPDLVILDVMMDHLSEGFDVARSLREDPRTARVPVMMLTGVDKVYDLRMQVDESWLAADRYVEKPVPPATLLEHVEELIGAEND